jgi:hypothetical protein
MNMSNPMPNARMMKIEDIQTKLQEVNKNFDGNMFALRNTLTYQRTLFDYTNIYKIVRCNKSFILMFIDTSWLQISSNDEDWIYSPGDASEGLDFTFRPYDTDHHTFIQLLCRRDNEYIWIKNSDMWLRIPYALK